MDRVAIKEEAKSKIKGNLWNILWPILVIGVIFGVLGTPFQAKIDLQTFKMAPLQPWQSAGASIITFLELIVTAGYTKYVLNFARTGNFDTSVILDTIKKRWLVLLCASILVGIIVCIGTILLVIPGIIAALGLAPYIYVAVDTDLDTIEVLKKTWNMMKGHKMEYFIFGLSFIGWCLLIPFTIGLICIWLVRYMNVATALYYDKLPKD